MSKHNFKYYFFI